MIIQIWQFLKIGAHMIVFKMNLLTFRFIDFDSTYSIFNMAKLLAFERLMCYNYSLLFSSEWYWNPR